MFQRDYRMWLLIPCLILMAGIYVTYIVKYHLDDVGEEKEWYPSNYTVSEIPFHGDGDVDLVGRAVVDSEKMNTTIYLCGDQTLHDVVVSVTLVSHDWTLDRGGYNLTNSRTYTKKYETPQIERMTVYPVRIPVVVSVTDNVPRIQFPSIVSVESRQGHWEGALDTSKWLTSSGR